MLSAVGVWTNFVSVTFAHVTASRSAVSRNVHLGPREPEGSVIVIAVGSPDMASQGHQLVGCVAMVSKIVVL